ncbi:hypothetical protein Q7P37_002135 [Cladosporium fusiforme]
MPQKTWDFASMAGVRGGLNELLANFTTLMNIIFEIFSRAKKYGAEADLHDDHPNPHLSNVRSASDNSFVLDEDRVWYQSTGYWGPREACHSGALAPFLQYGPLVESKTK